MVPLIDQFWQQYWKEKHGAQKIPKAVDFQDSKFREWFTTNATVIQQVFNLINQVLFLLCHTSFLR